MSAPFDLAPELGTRIAKWALGGDTGVSSETIACVALGLTPDKHNYRFDTPSDGSDFGRCYRLLKAIPELRAVLPWVVAACPKWGPLVAIWDELVELYEKDQAEEPIYEKVSRGPGRKSYQHMVNKRSCYDRIKGLYDECMIAGGWVKTGSCTWTKGNQEEEE